MTDKEVFEEWYWAAGTPPSYETRESETALCVWQAATLAERERCAKVCERTKGLGRDGWPTHYSANECAATIRKGPTP